MKKRPFYFEIKDLLIQFATAFDDIVIQRHNKQRQPEQRIAVRYVFAPKHRVLYDIVNLQKNLTLPVVSMVLTGVSRDNNRVFNKNYGFQYLNTKGTETSTEHILMPVPVNLNVSVSIITKLQSDMDQILSNFIPYANPYVILAWKYPKEMNLKIDQEIRSEVMWDGNISITQPTDLSAVQKYQIVADTTFVIKGWLFKDKENPDGNIFYISNNFNVQSVITDYESLSGDTFTYPLSTGLVNETEFVGVSGNP